MSFWIVVFKIFHKHSYPLISDFESIFFVEETRISGKK